MVRVQMLWGLVYIVEFLEWSEWFSDKIGVKEKAILGEK